MSAPPEERNAANLGDTCLYRRARHSLEKPGAKPIMSIGAIRGQWYGDESLLQLVCSGRACPYCNGIPHTQRTSVRRTRSSSVSNSRSGSADRKTARPGSRTKS